MNKYLLEQYEVTIDKQGYLENCLDELGGIRFNKDNIKVGYIVIIKSSGQCEIISAGPVNVGYKILTGGAAGMTLTATYAEIKEVIKGEEKKRVPHPFKVGERFTAKVWDSSMGIGKSALHNEFILQYIRYAVKSEMAIEENNAKDAKEWGNLFHGRGGIRIYIMTYCENGCRTYIRLYCNPPGRWSTRIQG